MADWIARARKLGWRFFYDEVDRVLYAVHPTAGRHRLVEIAETPTVTADTVGRVIEAHLNGDS